MKKFATTIIAIFAMLALVSPLYAAGEKKMKSDHGQQTSSLQGQSAEELKGKKIVSQNGESIGEIKEVKMDQQNEKIHYITLTKSDAMGGQEQEVAAPPEVFSFDREKDEVRLTIDESRLDNAPRPDEATMSDEQFQRDLQSHYGISPTWEQGADPADTTQTPQLDQPTGEPAPQTNVESQNFQDPRKNKTDY